MFRIYSSSFLEEGVILKKKLISLILALSILICSVSVKVERVDAAAITVGGLTVAEFLFSLGMSCISTYLVYDAISANDIDDELQEQVDQYMSNDSTAKELDDEQVELSIKSGFVGRVIQHPNDYRSPDNNNNRKAGKFSGLYLTARISKALKSILESVDLQKKISELCDTKFETMLFSEFYCNSDLVDNSLYMNAMLCSQADFDKAFEKYKPECDLDACIPFCILSVKKYPSVGDCDDYVIYKNPNPDFDYHDPFFVSTKNRRPYLTSCFRDVNSPAIYNSYLLRNTGRDTKGIGYYTFRYFFEENKMVNTIKYNDIGKGYDRGFTPYNILFSENFFYIFYNPNGTVYRFNHIDKKMEKYDFDADMFKVAPDSDSYLTNPYRLDNFGNVNYDYSTTINKTIKKIEPKRKIQEVPDPGTGEVIESDVIEIPSYDYSTIEKLNNEIIPEIQKKPATEGATRADNVMESIGKNADSAVLVDTAGNPQTVTIVDTVDKSDVKNNFNNNQMYGNADLTDIFPFCIPFDFTNIVKKLNATPEAPKFEVPMYTLNKNLSIKKLDKGLVIDLSNFDIVAAAVRKFELLILIVGLIFVSYKLVGGGKT